MREIEKTKKNKTKKKKKNNNKNKKKKEEEKKEEEDDMSPSPIDHWVWAVDLSRRRRCNLDLGCTMLFLVLPGWSRRDTLRLGAWGHGGVGSAGTPATSPAKDFSYEGSPWDERGRVPESLSGRDASIASEFCRERPFTRNFRNENVIWAISFARTIPRQSWMGGERTEKQNLARMARWKPLFETLRKLFLKWSAEGNSGSF